ncbi:hypothetical protein HY213_05400 [Candidatus Peregrinibacteria bacterium]|nr:hypothetical protein [Candidatus Peregrinibacteria bacterium]
MPCHAYVLFMDETVPESTQNVILDEMVERYRQATPEVRAAVVDAVSSLTIRDISHHVAEALRLVRWQRAAPRPLDDDADVAAALERAALHLQRTLGEIASISAARGVPVDDELRLASTND